MKKLPSIRVGIGMQRALLRGHLTGQMVLWVASLGYATVYGAEAYGVFALFLSVVNVCGLLACLGFEIALLLPIGQDEARRLLTGCFLMVTFSTILMGGLLCIFRLAVPLPGPVGWLILAIWGQGILVVRQEWYTRRGDYKKLGRLWQRQYVLMAILQGMCFFPFPDKGLMVGYAWTMGIIGGSFCWQSRHCLRVDRLFTLSFGGYWQIIYLDLGGRGLQLLARHIQPLLLVPCFGPIKAAHFFLAQQLLGKPLQALVAGVRSPFLNRSIARLQTGDWPSIRMDARRVVFRLSVIVLPVWCLLIGVLIATQFWLPAEWQDLGSILLLMLPLYLGKTWFSPISGLAPPLRKTNWTFLYNGFLFGWSLLSVGTGYISQSFHGFLLVYSWGGGLGYLWLHHRFNQYLKDNEMVPV